MTPLTLIITSASAWMIIKVSGHKHRWLTGGYDLKIGHFVKWLASIVVTWWIVFFWGCAFIDIYTLIQAPNLRDIKFATCSPKADCPLGALCLIWGSAILAMSDVHDTRCPH